MKKSGYFISFEGIEGVGKTTALQFARDYIEKKKINYVMTREPGGTPIAEAIRSVLLNHYTEAMSRDTELLLMFAGRAQNIAQVILPALERGQWVLSDRFTDASFAYQGGGRGVPIEHIEQLARWVQKDLAPDVTILLDMPVEAAFNRVTSRGAKDRIEAEGMDFFERVREKYLQLAKKNAKRFRVIRADQSMDEIKQAIESVIDALLEE